MITGSFTFRWELGNDKVVKTSDFDFDFGPSTSEPSDFSDDFGSTGFDASATSSKSDDAFAPFKPSEVSVQFFGDSWPGSDSATINQKNVVLKSVDFGPEGFWDCTAKTVVLDWKEGNVFEKTVDFEFTSESDSLYYRYSVDGIWTTKDTVTICYDHISFPSGVHVLTPNQLFNNGRALSIRHEAQPSAPGPSPIPPLTPEKASQYARLFERTGAQNGVLLGEARQMIFEPSGLPHEVLGRIWHLADTEQRGSLRITEFVIAMHLIASFKTGALGALPSTLTAELFHAAERRPPSATGISDSTDRARSQTITINQMPPDSYPYRKLDFDTYETRVLRLNWSIKESDPIVCSLEHVSLIDPGSYVALSYCVRSSVFAFPLPNHCFHFSGGAYTLNCGPVP